MQTMTKGIELVKELSEKVNYLDTAIERLEVELDDLKNSLNTSGNQFDMDVVKKNKQIQHEIDMTRQTLQKAKNERQNIIEGNAADTFNKAKKAIADNQKVKQAQHKADNLEIIEHINAIREKVKLIKDKDKEYSKEVNEFLSEIRPFLDKEPSGPLNQLSEKKYEHLSRFTRPNGTFTVLELANERSFMIEGLTVEPRNSEKEEQEIARFK